MADDTDVTIPDPVRLDRLLAWHLGCAQRDGSLALSLEAEGLAEAARRNRLRADAHRETALLLELLKYPAQPEPAPFRSHLTGKPRPKAQIRAPP